MSSRVRKLSPRCAIHLSRRSPNIEAEQLQAGAGRAIVHATIRVATLTLLMGIVWKFVICLVAFFLSGMVVNSGRLKASSNFVALEQNGTLL
jgi:hypothetical protein